LHKVVFVDNFEQDEVADADPIVARHGAAILSARHLAKESLVLVAGADGEPLLLDGNSANQMCFFAAAERST